MDTWLIIWLVVLVLCILVEIFTMGLTSIWFAGGALAASIIAAFGGPVWLQLLLFVVVTFLLLGFTRPIAVRYFNKERQKTNVESLIGQKGIVISEIDNLRGIGQVRIGGQEWSARSREQDLLIPEGAIVEVTAISGVKLIVTLDESIRDHVEKKTSDESLNPELIEEE